MAYLAAPASAAVASVAQQAPSVAAEASQAAFAAQVEEREETVEESTDVRGNVIDANTEGGDGSEYAPRERRRGARASDEDAESPPLERHFIDTTA